MSERNLMLPGNPRYQPKEMQGIFGYDNLYQQFARVEISGLEVLGEIRVIPPAEISLLLPEIISQLQNISTTQVDDVERKITHHDARAWIRLAQEIMDKRLSRWLHIPYTTYDPMDTGRILQFIQAYNEALKPSLIKLVGLFAEQVRKYANQLQIGRTHGQHALPITVGFWLATILNRIIVNWEMMDTFCLGLNGKISGAVGAFNAQIGCGINDKCGEKSFEERVLAKLNLRPARISTQINQPEPLGYFLFSAVMMSAAFGQFGRDCRQLMRSEIGEIQEEFEAGQVGSSTMAHKRNPINFENLEGTWLKTKNEFGNVFDTLISEHQRDLVNSSVYRDFPTILINLQLQLNTLLRENKGGIPFMSRITINKEACGRNFQLNAHLILAEPLYIALQMAGYLGDAHKLVNEKLVPKAAAGRLLLADVLEEISFDEPELRQAVEKIPPEVWQLLHHPENYTGLAEAKALEIANYAEKLIAKLQ